MKRGTSPVRLPLRYVFCVVAVWVLALCPCLSGCGKKALPLPPHSDPVPPVTDLSYELRGAHVVLTWTVPDEVRKGAFGEGEMILFRAKTKRTDELCPECPRAFQRIGLLPILRADNEPKPTYGEEVQKGFRYTYKVVLHMESGRSSGPSNLIEFDYRDTNT
jgi:hypothetical protein